MTTTDAGRERRAAAREIPESVYADMHDALNRWHIDFDDSTDVDEIVADLIESHHAALAGAGYQLTHAASAAAGSVTISLDVAKDAYFAMDTTREITVMQWHADRERFHRSKDELARLLAAAAASAETSGEEG